MEAILVVGFISVIGSLILRLLTVLDNMHTNKIVITNNLLQLHQINYGHEINLKLKQEYLYELNQNVSKQLGIKPPPIYLQDTETDNAIAINTGFFQAVIFEQRTFEGLSAQGLGAVLAHELYHIQQKHYLKSVTRHLFLSTAWLILNVFILAHVVDSLHMQEPMTKAENYYWIICLMFFYSGASLMGDHFSLAFDRLISRRQEIECDVFCAQATSFSDYMIEAEYFKTREDSFWRSITLSGVRAIKFQVYSTHPDWHKRILAVARSKDK